MIEGRVLVEIVVSFIWMFYYIGEAVVKAVLPEKLFYKDVSGQIVLLTGGGSGIGRLMCLRLARLGATVVTWDINTNGNEETVRLVKAEGGKAYAYTVDMSNRDDIYKSAARLKEDLGSVSILINNAGIVSGDLLLNTPDKKIQKTFEVNTLAHFYTMKAFLPDMLDNKQGHIVNVASLAGHNGTNKLVDYCASKFAAVGIDEAFRTEMFVQGHSDYIKTTVICPYYINTGMFSGVSSKVIPILEPSFVADKCVSAIRLNHEVVMLPSFWAYLLGFFKALIPPKATMKIAQAFGFNCSMDQFEGREKSD